MNPKIKKQRRFQNDPRHLLFHERGLRASHVAGMAGGREGAGVMGFCIEPIEILALRKLALVSKALAVKLGGQAGREQDCLAQTLVDLLDRYEIEAAKPRRDPTEAFDGGRLG